MYHPVGPLAYRKASQYRSVSTHTTQTHDPFQVNVHLGQQSKAVLFYLQVRWPLLQGQTFVPEFAA